jgi:hypothetical protein
MNLALKSIPAVRVSLRHGGESNPLSKEGALFGVCPVGPALRSACPIAVPHRGASAKVPCRLRRKAECRQAPEYGKYEQGAAATLDIMSGLSGIGVVIVDDRCLNKLPSWTDSGGHRATLIFPRAGLYPIHSEPESVTIAAPSPRTKGY